MRSAKQYSECLNSIKGKVIALVYIFEKEDAAGYDHYDIWKSDVICSWLTGVQELRCMPLILDARTFVAKAMSGTLPTIDYVINLNNGNNKLSTLGLIPSVCSFFNIPCIPCETLTIVSGENKKLSNIISESIGFSVPAGIDSANAPFIIRPNNFGSSIGVRLSIDPKQDESAESIVQEFISGFDLTTPILYNPIHEKLEVLSPIMYSSNNSNPEWFLGEDEKNTHSGYTKIGVSIDNKAKQLYLNLAKAIGITTFCRIDARVKCRQAEIDYFKTNIIPSDRIFFLEINPMPTVKSNINFHTSIEYAKSGDPLFECINLYKALVADYSYTGFILSCAIIALIDFRAKR